MALAKEKAASPCQGEAAQQTNLNLNSNRPDALLQWHALAKNVKDSRINHQPKREWKRGRK